MNKLEQANISTQIELYKDIQSAQSSINYEIQQKAKEGAGLLRERILKEEGKVVELSKETFDKIWEILFVISEKTKWHQLGILSKDYIPMQEMKMQILQKLQQ